jgi:pimeloyl-ACP methyl ester carboxylesterase
MARVSKISRTWSPPEFGPPGRGGMGTGYATASQRPPATSATGSLDWEDGGVSAAQTRILTTSDDVEISAVHVPGPPDLGFVVVHGFTGNWRQERVQRVIDRLRAFGGVVALDMRGHGESGGSTTVGDEEIADVEAAVAWARELGYPRVVTVGFSLGGAVVLREAALLADGPGRVDGVVSVSAPAFWYYRGTRIMRVAHWMVETRPGRLTMRLRRTRISARGWQEPLPIQPVEAAERLAGIPLLVVHGDADHYFPLEHPKAIHAAAQRSGARADLWIEPGFRHAESAATADVLDRIGAWARECAVGAAGSGST